MGKWPREKRQGKTANIKSPNNVKSHPITLHMNLRGILAMTPYVQTSLIIFASDPSDLSSQRILAALSFMQPVAAAKSTKDGPGRKPRAQHSLARRPPRPPLQGNAAPNSPCQGLSGGKGPNRLISRVSALPFRTPAKGIGWAPYKKPPFFANIPPVAPPGATGAERLGGPD
jgi:hypothetical protein